MIWFSLGGLDGFVDELQAFEPTREEEYEYFGPYNQYRYGYSTAGSSCLVCQKSEIGRRRKIEFRQPSLSTQPWFHYHCVDTLCDVLEATWSHTSELLIDEL